MEKPPLRDVLSYYGVDLHGSRREAQVNCPVHEESRPSCSVNEDEGLWNCLACGAGGDSWTLITLKEGFSDFGSSVRFAEEKFGFSGAGIQQPARGRRGGPGVSRKQGSFRPGFRNSPSRGRPLSSA